MEEQERRQLVTAICERMMERLQKENPGVEYRRKRWLRNREVYPWERCKVCGETPRHSGGLCYTCAKNSGLP